MFQVNSSLFICIICILVAPPDSKWFKPWFYSSCPLSWCMRVAKQFFDSPGSWLASNLCSSRPKTSGIVWLDVPHHSQDEKAGNPEGPQIRWMEKNEKKGGVYEKAQQDRQQLQQLRFLEALLPCPSVSEFFALFLQIVLDVLLTPVHFHMR